jgi:hypothetical protein
MPFRVDFSESIRNLDLRMFPAYSCEQTTLPTVVLLGIGMVGIAARMRRERCDNDHGETRSLQ